MNRGRDSTVSVIDWYITRDNNKATYIHNDEFRLYNAEHDHPDFNPTPY